MSRWPRVPLASLDRIITGKTPATIDRTNYGADIPFVRPGDLRGDEPIIDAEIRLSAKERRAPIYCPQGVYLFAALALLNELE